MVPGKAKCRTTGRSRAFWGPVSEADICALWCNWGGGMMKLDPEWKQRDGDGAQA